MLPMKNLFTFIKKQNKSNLNLVEISLDERTYKSFDKHKGGCMIDVSSWCDVKRRYHTFTNLFLGEKPITYIRIKKDWFEIYFDTAENIPESLIINSFGGAIAKLIFPDTHFEECKVKQMIEDVLDNVFSLIPYYELNLLFKLKSGSALEIEYQRAKPLREKEEAKVEKAPKEENNLKELIKKGSMLFEELAEEDKRHKEAKDKNTQKLLSLFKDVLTILKDKHND